MGEFLIPVSQITAAVACDNQLFTSQLVLLLQRPHLSCSGISVGRLQAGGSASYD